MIIGDYPMGKPVAVIVSGPPASGKTTLARVVARETCLPFFYKDGLKEALFDALGWSDRIWSRRIGAASFALLRQIMTAQLAAGQSFVVEANFRASEDTAMFQALQARYPFTPLLIHCMADSETLLQRFLARAATDDRHPGHVELDNTDEWRVSALDWRHWQPLDLGGTVYRVDTSDFTRVDVAALVRVVRTAVVEARSELRETTTTIELT